MAKVKLPADGYIFSPDVDAGQPDASGFGDAGLHPAVPAHGSTGTR